MTERRRLWWLASLLAAIAFSPAPVCRAASDCRDVSLPVALSSRRATKLLISQARPRYPPAAQVNYISGKVELAVTVGCQGRVALIHVISGHAFLAQAAIDAVHRWVYRPYRDRSGPVPFQTRVNVNFALRNPNLTHFPARPDQDLLRAVRPPRLVPAPGLRAAGDSPRLRMLVSSHGRVIDATLLRGTPADFQQARAVVTSWKFIPAKCDNLDVPWYVEMAVPLPDSSKRANGAGTAKAHAQPGC